MSTPTKILCLLIAFQLTFATFFYGQDFNLIIKPAKAQEPDSTEDEISAQEEEQLYQQALKGESPYKLTEEEQKINARNQSLQNIAEKINLSIVGSPKLILNPTDIEILKSKIDSSSGKLLVSNNESQILTDLSNSLKNADQATAQNLVKDGLNQIFDPNNKYILRIALSKIDENHLEDGRDQIRALAEDNNYQYRDSTLEKYKDLTVDRRTLEALIYLVTPSNEGGAGHERIKVERIWKDFEDEGATAKNHPQMPEGAEDPHFRGQALDISEIDLLKCTLIKKKRLGKDKKIPQAPQAIKVAYQTKSGISDLKSPFGDTMNDIFKNLASGNLADLFQELGLTSGLSAEDLKTASVEDISYYLGSSFVMSILQTKKTPDWKDMKGGVEALGSAYIEEAIGLPRGVFTGASYDQMIENLGRRNLEDKLRLPAGSLLGKNGEEILIQIGKKHFAAQTKDKSHTAYHPNQLDEALGLPEDSFNKAKAGDQPILKQIGAQILSERITSETNSRNIIYGLLQNVEIDRNSSPNPLKGGEYSYAEQDFKTQFETEGGFKQNCETIGGRAEMGEIQENNPGFPNPRSFSTTFHCYKKYEQKDLPEAILISALNLSANDFVRVFQGTGASEVFQHQGTKIFASLLKNSQLAQQTEQELLARHPEIQEVKANFDFRKNALEQAQSQFDQAIALQAQISGLKNNSAFSQPASNIKNTLTNILKKPSINGIKAAVKLTQTETDKLQIEAEKNNTDQKTAELKQHLALAQLHLRAAIEGEYPEVQGADSASQSGGANPASELSQKDKYKALYKQKKPLIDTIIKLAKNEISPEKAALAFGAETLSQNLGLPSGSFGFVTEQNPDLTADSFYISVGKAKFQQVFGETFFDDLINEKTPAEIDRLLGLYQGATQEYLSSPERNDDFTREKSINLYYKKIGRQTLKYTAFSQAIKQEFNLGGYFLTPDDIFGILSGDTKSVFNRIAGAKFDNGLRLTPGRGETLFNAYTAKYETKDKKNEAINSALNQISSEVIFGLLDMPAVDLSGSVPRNLAASRTEQILGLNPGSINPNDENATIQTILDKNGPFIFSQAFRIPLPFSDDYTQSQFQQDVGSSSDEAKQRLDTFKTRLLIRINGLRQTDSVWWKDKEYFEKGLGVSETEKQQVQNFQTQISALEKMLYVPQGNIKKLLTAEINVKQFLDNASDAKNTADYLLRNSGAVAKASEQLAQQLGLEGDYKNTFAGGLNNILSNLILNPSAISKTDFYTTFSPIIDDKLNFASGTFSNILQDPEGGIIKLVDQGMIMLDDNFGIGNKIANLYKTDVFVERCGWAFGSKKCDITGFEEDIIKLINQNSNNAIDRIAPASNQSARQLITQDMGLLAQGDTRVIGLISGVYMVNNFLMPKTDDHASEAQKRGVPPNIAPTYDDYRKAILGNPSDQTRINDAGEQNYEQNFESEVSALGSADHNTIKQLENDLKTEGMRREEAQLRQGYQKNLQYKIMDSQLYKLDPHIPAGFAQKMFEADENGKASALADLGLNYINDNTLLGAIFKNDSKTRDAVLNYITNPSKDNIDKIALDGFAALEGYMNTKQVFGKIKIENGTFRTIYLATGTGDYKTMVNDLTNLYKTQWQTFAFSFADAKLGLPVGKSLEVYKAYKTFDGALRAYKTAKAAVATAQGADKLLALNTVNVEGANLSQAKGEIIAIVLTLVVTEIFGEQMVAIDQDLGLVPGSTAMLTGMAIYYYVVPSPDPVTLGIMIAAFILTNLFGTYKIKYVCTADGYYPGIASAPADPALSLGLGVFDGMNNQNYQAGTMRAAQAKVDDLVSDTMDLGYHYKDGGKFAKEPYDSPDELTKPIQIITFRQETLDKFFGSIRYREVFSKMTPNIPPWREYGAGISKIKNIFAF
ncbi:MAG: hypothetical protein CEN89_416 [Candidatus Berkelbacteria bacterium Licking1014_7]|uniref:Uncharacterized protein n=1 Tax=Candidatus Berkelbacteria bacterium Licking1014_7 TaxID=2017147 RepID=A0A554LJ86_9BACT|nr:MAG: hypothetical protein CEN89_416 [Candidatus Berkelbacteria bacterium Licking1014_7]